MRLKRCPIIAIGPAAATPNCASPKNLEFQPSSRNTSPTMAQPPQPVLDLIRRFEQNREAYHSPTYNETQQTLQPVLRIFRERALPDQGNNIKCGNSLIHPDFGQPSRADSPRGAALGRKT